MLKVNCPKLPRTLSNYLARRRDHDRPWNHLSGTPSAEQIKDRLCQAFHDKCGYCEKIEAQTVDHFYPQTTAKRRWDWENFILACDRCQSAKLAAPPKHGRYRMINPRRDEPLHYLQFDFETGWVAPLPTSPLIEGRGRATIKVLEFDERSRLAEQRRITFLDVIDCMERVVRPSSHTDAQKAWQKLMNHLKPTRPYLGIIRQLIRVQNRYTPLVTALRNARPEFDNEIREWCLPLEN